MTLEINWDKVDAIRKAKEQTEDELIKSIINEKTGRPYSVASYYKTRSGKFIKPSQDFIAALSKALGIKPEGITFWSENSV